MIEQVALGGESAAEVCRVLGASRSAYYAWLGGGPGARAQEDAEFGPQVEQSFRANNRRYGARRIAEDLKEQGWRISRRRVGRLMRERKLRAIQPKSFKPRTTDSRHRLGYNANLLLGADPPRDVNQVYVADITYVPLADGGFCYLATLLDLHSRRITGWALQESMTEDLVLAALRACLRSRQPPAGCIHHSDRGGQYAGHRYRTALRRAGLRQSMSRADDCYDNAFMESCFSTIKRELEMQSYQDLAEARREISEYIGYYNIRRRHSSIKYLSPAQFERQHTGPSRNNRTK